RGIQPFFFVQQNLVEGIPGGPRRLVDSIRKKFPRFLTMRVLMVGCAAGEGHLGALSPADSIWIAEALHECLPQIARTAKASLVVLKDFPSKYRDTLAGFSRNACVFSSGGSIAASSPSAFAWCTMVRSTTNISAWTIPLRSTSTFIFTRCATFCGGPSRIG